MKALSVMVTLHPRLEKGTQCDAGSTWRSGRPTASPTGRPREWVAKKAIESGDRGYELVGFDISRAGSVQRALARDRDVQAPPDLRPGILCLGVSSRYDLFTCAFDQEWPP